jgi:HD-like signal output (HDOD) protein
MINSNVEQILAAAKRMKAPSPMLGTLMTVLSRPDHETDEVVKLVMREPELAASVLRMANSAAFGRAGSQIASIPQAVVRVGEIELERMVANRLCGFVRVGSVEGYGLEYDGLWHKSLRSGLAAAEIAKRVATPQTGAAYAAGLLLDLGKLALGPWVAAQTPRLLAAIHDEPERGFADVETMILGIDHAELGGRIAEHWKLPTVLIAAIRFHHHPSQATGHEEMCWIAHLADALATMAGGSDSIDGLNHPLEEQWEAHVPLSQVEVENIILTVSIEASRSISLD